MSIFISCYTPFYLISIEQDLFIPSSAPAWIFISNSNSRLSSRRPNSRSCSAGMQPAKGRGFCTILVKMLHISVKINENKRAACSNRRHCCLIFLFSWESVLKSMERCGFSRGSRQLFPTLFFSFSFSNSLCLDAQRAWCAMGAFKGHLIYSMI